MEVRRLQSQPARSAIRDWQLQEADNSRYTSYFLPGILKVVSKDGKEECFRLLRAIVNLYINSRLQRQGVTRHWKRERKLVINYLRKEDWEWRVELLDVARAYHHFENREKHLALIEIAGSIIRFESGISQINLTI
jgi:hypothetical protein